MAIEGDISARLFARSGGERWGLTLDAFAAALARSVRHRFPTEPTTTVTRAFVDALHVEDLALACACAAGHEAAWEHFVGEFRPVLYRAADAVDPGGGCREIADLLYGELFGVDPRGVAKPSLFRYYHGRSSLATWLRAVLAQRYVDRVRVQRRHTPLADADADAAPVAVDPADPDRRRLFAAIVGAFTLAVTALSPRDRLRLGAYYEQRLTLAEIGRLFGEHEATASRQLTRIRKELRTRINAHLKDRLRLSAAEIAQAEQYAMDDAGTLDLGRLLAAHSARAVSVKDDV